MKDAQRRICLIERPRCGPDLRAPVSSSRRKWRLRIRITTPDPQVAVS